MSSQLHKKLKEEAKNLGEAISYCCQLSWSTSRIYMVIELTASVILSTLPFASLYLSKLILDYLVNPGNIIIYVSKNLIFLFMINVFSIVLRQILSYVQTIHGKLMQFKLQENLMWKSMTMDMSFFDSPDYLDAMQAVRNNAVGLPNCMWNILTCLNCGISAVYSFFLFSEVSVLLAIMVSVFSIPAAIVNRRYAKRLFELRLALTPESRQLSYLQSISAHKAYAGDIRLFDLSENFIGRYKNLSDKIIGQEKKIIRRSILAKSVSGAMPQFCIYMVLVMLVNHISKGQMTVGDYSLYSGLLTTLTSSIAQFISALVGIYEDKLRTLTVKKFEGRVNNVVDCGKNVLTEINSIEFKDVFFRYPDSDEDTLKNLSFKIKQNEKLCIVGVNGAGKSTIIKLMLRFYDTSSGEILINGKNIKEYTLISLRKNFSSLFQVYDRYAFSLRENVTISDLERTQDGDEAVFNALLNAGSKEILHKVNNKLDIGLSRLFDSEGVELSGGELQKIALARAIYRRCSAMILDEPSAALDPYAENEMLKSMEENTRGKIVIFTAHRLSTVFIADRILVLEDGTVVEAGTHEELLCEHGKYAELYQAQAGKYIIR